MTEKRTLCLMNDSFPPLIDGVANAVVNYASFYQKNHGTALVATPYNPDADDSRFPFQVERYRSFDTTRLVGYRAGYPFSVENMRHLKEANVDIIHTHCPFMSTYLARTLRDVNEAPVVFTYHTKFDVDIAKTLSSKHLQEKAVQLVVNNVQACDEVWVVSRGAGENLRSLGYQGDYIVMENGVEYPKGRVSEAEIAAVGQGYDLPEGVPVFLFVGRMMWYKGLRIIFDGLKQLQREGKDFRMILIGDGMDRVSMENYAKAIGIGSRCTFTGAIRDREILRAWYCRSNLFLFPSTYDTNGLVVREAASCGLGSVLIDGSCAAEGVSDCRNGFLIEENAPAMAAILSRLCDEPETMRRIGENAMNELYLSWEDSVARAAERYEVVLEKAKRGELSRQKSLADGFIHATAEVMEGVEALRDFREDPKGELRAMAAWQKGHLGRFIDSFWQYLDKNK